MSSPHIPVHSLAKKAPSFMSDMSPSGCVPTTQPILSTPLALANVQESGSSQSEDLDVTLPFQRHDYRGF